MTPISGQWVDQALGWLDDTYAPSAALFGYLPRASPPHQPYPAFSAHHKGWVSLLVRGAFAVRTVRCSDCGAVNRYKTVGSWIAMAVLIFLLLCIIAAVTTDDYQ